MPLNRDDARRAAEGVANSFGFTDEMKQEFVDECMTVYDSGIQPEPDEEATSERDRAFNDWIQEVWPSIH